MNGRTEKGRLKPRIAVASSALPALQYWRIDGASRQALQELLGHEPSPDEVKGVEEAVRDYQHVWKRFEGGIGLEEAKWGLKRFEEALSVVVAFLDDECDHADPCQQHRQREAAFMLLAHNGTPNGPPPGSWGQLRDLALAYLKESRVAQEVKVGIVRDPAAATLFVALANAIERLGGKITVRGHQADAQEPWSLFVQLAFAVHTSVACHIHHIAPGQNDPRLPIKNSGFPKAVFNALAQRKKGRTD